MLPFLHWFVRTCTAIALLGAITLLGALGVAWAAPPSSLPANCWVDVDGRSLATDRPPLRVLCFLGCECPVARLYASRLQELAAEFDPKSVQWIAVFSNPQDSADDIRRFASELALTFACVSDSEQRFAKSFQATRTVEVVVLDAQGNIPYRGRVDDQYAPGVKRARTQRTELRDALQSLVVGETPTIRITEPVGCAITWTREPDADATLTYASGIADLFYRHCYECHRPEEIGPFNIADADEVRGWSEMILEVIDNGRMPPWHADPHYGSFRNQRAMPSEDIEAIRSWVRAGAPLGDREKIPAPPSASSGWRLDHEPDRIVAMRNKPFAVPASGAVEYQYFVVDPEFENDLWVSGAQVVPGDPAVVHHAIAFIRPPDGQEFSGTGWLTAYVPGQMATRFPPGYARKIPAGSKLVFQMHYTPNGREAEDLSQVGMTFVDEASVTHEVITLAGLDQDFEIPPGAASHEVVTALNRLPIDGELLAVSPHMHLRGKSFELRCLDTKGASSVLLRVPRYDFNWQHTYEFSERVPLVDLQRLEFTATFDNSENNPFNPDPQEYVMWGDQTWEEMALAFFEVARPRQPSAEPKIVTNPTPTNGEEAKSSSPSPRAIAYADEFLRGMDRDGDGFVAWEEATNVVRNYSFARLDRDGDRRISRDELTQAVDERRAK